MSVMRVPPEKAPALSPRTQQLWLAAMRYRKLADAAASKAASQ